MKHAQLEGLLGATLRVVQRMRARNENPLSAKENIRGVARVQRTKEATWRQSDVQVGNHSVGGCDPYHNIKTLPEDSKHELMTETETRQQIGHGSAISEGSIPNLAIEGIFTFLFAPKSIRWGIRGCEYPSSDHVPFSKPNQTPSADVKRFCILRSLNSLFWERSYEFVRSLAEEKALLFIGDYPPLTILQGVVGILKLWSLKDIGTLDLSSLQFVEDLELGNIRGRFSLTPPPNLESLKIYKSEIDMVDLIQGLKEPKIIKLEIWWLEDIGRLDLSSLLSLKDLELGDIRGRFSLTPPPNLESFKIYRSNIDMVDLIQDLKETKIIKLEIWGLKDIGTLDLSSLLSVKDLKLRCVNGHFSLTPPPNLESLNFQGSNIDMVDLIQSVNGHFSLTPPPNLESLNFQGSNIDMVDLIQRLKETKIIKLEIWYLNDIGTLDLSSLLSVKDLELVDIRGRFSLTPPPNLASFKFDDLDIDMIGFNHSENWKPT